MEQHAAQPFLLQPRAQPGEVLELAFAEPDVGVGGREMSEHPGQAQAVQRRERIAVFADYDVDGGTSAALLLDWLGQMGKTKHLMKEGNEDRLAAIEKEVMRRWRRIKAMHENPEL